MQPNQQTDKPGFESSQTPTSQAISAPVEPQPQGPASVAPQVSPQQQINVAEHEATVSGNSGTKLQVIGGILLVCSIFGIVEIIFHVISNLLLGNPAVNSSGRAAVNIATLSSGAIGFISGIILLIVGSVRKARK